MKEESPDTETSRRKQVLIVDDERGIVDSLAAIFRRAGYEAVSAYDAASALRHCNGTCPDLVLGDVMMPGMNGIDMAIQIRQRRLLISIARSIRTKRKPLSGYPTAKGFLFSEQEKR